MQLIKTDSNVALYLPESFGWLILKSGLIEEGSIADMLKHPEDYIESKDYFSWERYFTALLIQNTQGSYMKYAKQQLNHVYLQEKVSDKILSVMRGIDLT